MFTTESVIQVNRPIEDVFSYIVQSENLAKWAGPVTEVRSESDEPVGIGSRETRIIQFLGRKAEVDYEVIEYEKNKKYTTKSTSGPMSTEERFTFEAVENGTSITIQGDVDATGWFKLAEPLIVRMTKRQQATDFANLKDLLESEA